MSHLHIDFETRSTVDLRKCGADVYARHPSTGVMCVGWAFDDEPVQIWKSSDRDSPLYDLFAHVLMGRTIIAHNSAFELAIWNEVMTREFGAPYLIPEQTLCTMTMAYAMSLPGSLEKASAAVGIDKQKDMAGNRVMMQLSQPRDVKEDGTVIWWEDEEKYKRLYEYCKQDIEVERELFKRLMKLSPKEKEVWILDQKINQRGISVDLKAVKTAIELVKMEKTRLDRDMREVTNNAVATCTATGQLTDWLKWRGVELDGVAKADVIELLSTTDLPDDCRKALLLRQEASKSSTAKLESMMNSACDDARIRGIFQYHGAGTGRWAGRRIQPQNFPRPKISQESVENVFKILTNIQEGK